MLPPIERVPLIHKSVLSGGLLLAYQNEVTPLVKVVLRALSPLKLAPAGNLTAPGQNAVLNSAGGIHPPRLNVNGVPLHTLRCGDGGFGSGARKTFTNLPTAHRIVQTGAKVN